MPDSLLAADEQPAVKVERESGSSPYVVVCDHASHTLPRALGDLGVETSALQTHIAWDIGAAGVASRLSELLDACLVSTMYSRLAIDANRPPRTAQSIVTESEQKPVPGNRALSLDQVEQRERSLFMPYHRTIRSLLDRRDQARTPTALCSVHSFTPRYLGEDRPWHVSVMYNRDPRLGHALRDALRADPALIVGDNEPYRVSDDTDYTVVVHAERRRIPYLMIELRQDLIEHEAGQTTWAERLARLLPGLLGGALSTS